MHIRDRLRLTFLRKEASRVCWRCVLSPRQQLRPLQTIHSTTGPSQFDVKPFEIESSPGDPLTTASKRLLNPDVANHRVITISPADSVKQSVATQKEDAPELLSEHPGLSVRRCRSENGKYLQAWHKEFKAKKQKSLEAKETHLKKYATARTSRDALQHNASTSEKAFDNHQYDGPGTRIETQPGDTIGDAEQSRVGDTTPKKALPQEQVRKAGRASAQSRPVRRKKWKLGMPTYVGPDRSRVYIFRKGSKRELRLVYVDPERLTDILKDSDRLKMETDSLIHTWLESDGSPKKNIPKNSRRKSVSGRTIGRQLYARNDHTSIKEGSRSQSPQVQTTNLTENPKGHPNPVTEHTQQSQNPSISFPEENMTSLPSSTQLSSASYSDRGLGNPMIMTNRWAGPTISIPFLREPGSSPQSFIRNLCTSATFRSPLDAQQSSPTETDLASQLPNVFDVGIRKHLTVWQESETIKNAGTPPSDIKDHERLVLTEDTTEQSGEEVSASNSGSIDPASAHDWDQISSSEKDEAGDTDVHNFLRPGDVIGFNTNRDGMLAVFIRNFEKQSQFYAMQGEWFHRISRHYGFTMRNVFSQQEIDPIMPYLPEKEVDSETLEQFNTMKVNVPRDVGANLIEKLQAIQNESHEIFRKHSERLDRAHSLVAHEWETKEMTLQEISLIVLQKENLDELTDTMLWTVNKALVKNPKFRSLNTILQRSAPRWNVNPLKLMRRFEQMRTWIREYVEGVVEQATSSQYDPISNPTEVKVQDSNPIPGFVRKARNLIHNSRLHRGVTALGGIGPSSPRTVTSGSPEDTKVQISPLEEFNPKERAILRILKTWSISRDIPSTGTAWALPPVLLRATELYGDKTDEATGFLFLQELGVIAPWENRHTYSVVYPLPTETVGIAADDTSRYTEDSLGRLRKDWGEMPVYCIDDAEAQEIDDGISLEKIEGNASEFWIHVHVANPSAFISPDSAIGKHAASVLQTIYLPEKNYPMLDPELTQGHFSLAKNRPVLTFSARVSIEGKIQENKVTPGWVHNIKRITPQILSQKLGFAKKPHEIGSRVLQVGQQVKSTRQIKASDELLPSDISELQILQKLGSARRFKRSRNEGAQGFHGSVPEPYVRIGPGGIGRTYGLIRGRQFIGDPFISWEAHEVDIGGELSRSDERNFVTDMMILAGEVAARWCSDRNIPIPYRGTIPNPAPHMSPEVYKSEVIDRSMRERGYVPIMLYRTYNRLCGQATIRPHPFPHAIMGTESYAKATSPLRRYGDMLIHWQIQAALLYEEKHGKDSLLNRQGDSQTDQSYLPFTTSALTRLLPKFEVHERSAIDMVKKSKMHWIVQLLHRAFYFGEETLPETLEVLVHAEPKALLVNGDALGYIKQLSGLDTDVLENEVSKREGGIKVGDRWECRMDGVDTYGNRVKVVPVRLLGREVCWRG